jgi:hypothetical protein
MTAGTAPHGVLARLAPVVSSLGLLGFACAAIVQFAAHGADDWERRLLESALLWLVGVQSLLIAAGHLFAPDRVADLIGWPRGNPFQFEVALASLSYGVLGVLAPSHGHQWWLATIVAYSIFYLGAAAGHVRQIVAEHNLSPGNAGPVLALDVALPVLLVVLYVLDRA